MKRKRKVGEWRLTEFGRIFLSGMLFTIVLVFVALLASDEGITGIVVGWLFSGWFLLLALGTDDNFMDDFDWLQCFLISFFIIPVVLLLGVWLLFDRLFEKVGRKESEADPVTEYYNDMAAPAYDNSGFSDSLEKWPDTIEVDGKWYYQDRESQTYKPEKE